jgi:imidazolonepropionase-like amidohydrolase
MNKIILFLFLFSLSELKAQMDHGNILIKNGTVLTITNGTLENTDVLIRDGKIQKIRKNISAAATDKVIDATGLFVMPGIIDPHSHIALSTINESSSPVTAEVNVGDAINPFDIDIYRALAGGVTTVHAMHGSANAIGGQCSVLKMRYGVLDPAGLVMEGAPRTIKFALGENPTRVHGANGVQPKSRMGVEFVIRQALSQAKEYNDQWGQYNQKKNIKGFRGAPPAYNLRMETLADILKGKITIHCHSYRADEIQMLLKVCQDFGIKKIVFQHVNEGFKVAPELAAAGAMASVFSDWWAYKFEVYYSTSYNASILARNGVITSLNSDDAETMRHLYHEAGKTQKYGGLKDEEALSLITINPAKQLGIDNRVGSVEEGKEGDIAIFKNHPLSIYTIPMMTIVEGVVRFDRGKDPDDMRLTLDPTKIIDNSTDYTYDKERDACMDGTGLFFESMVR